MSVDYSLNVVNELVRVTNSGKMRWSGLPRERRSEYNGHIFEFTGDNTILVDKKVQLDHVHQFENLTDAINAQLLDMDAVIADLKAEVDADA